MLNTYQESFLLYQTAHILCSLLRPLMTQSTLAKVMESLWECIWGEVVSLIEVSINRAAMLEVYFILITEWVKMRKSENRYAKWFADRIFRLVTSSTHYSWQTHTLSLPRYTAKYTHNISAAVMFKWLSLSPSVCALSVVFQSTFGLSNANKNVR